MPRAALSCGSDSLGSVSANRYCPLITPATRVIAFGTGTKRISSMIALRSPA